MPEYWESWDSLCSVSIIYHPSRTCIKQLCELCTLLFQQVMEIKSLWQSKRASYRACILLIFISVIPAQGTVSEGIMSWTDFLQRGQMGDVNSKMFSNIAEGTTTHLSPKCHLRFRRVFKWSSPCPYYIIEQLGSSFCCRNEISRH